jgi:hypothetical protein
MLNIASKTLARTLANHGQSVAHLNTAPATANTLQTVAKPAQNLPTKTINPLKFDNFFGTNELVTLEELFK